MKRILLTLALTMMAIIGYSQTSAVDCSFAINVCTNTGFMVSPNGPGVNELPPGTMVNPSTNPASTNSGCLLTGETNSTWMIVNISSSGTLEFSFGSSGSGGCLDWIMFPYNPSTTCSDIMSNSISPIRCNWNGNCDGYTGMASTLPFGGYAVNFEPPLNVNCGEQYLICLSNYSSVTTNVPLNFFGTATIACTTFNPITATATPDTICSGQQSTLVANGGITYTWSPGGTLSSTSGSTVTATPTSTTTYSVIGAGSCGTDTAYVTVTVNQCCVVTASGTNNICHDDTLFLSAVGTSGSTYQWTGPNGFTSNQQNPFILGPASGNYIVTLTNGTCIAIDTVTINVIQCCQVVGSAMSPICEGDNLIMTGIGNLPGTYTWTGPTGVVSYNQNVVVSSNGLQSGQYIVQLNTGSCIAYDTVNVIINPSPIAFFSTTPDTIDLNENQFVQFSDMTGTGTSWYWTFGAGEGTSTQQNPQYIYSDTGTFVVNLIVTDINGCTDTTSSQVIVTADFFVYIPNAFTPDGDGLNDIFLPSLYGSKSSEMFIFNRWGELIYQSGDASIGWNGSYKNQPCKEDVYVWRIMVKDVFNINHYYIGHVTIVK